MPFLVCGESQFTQSSITFLGDITYCPAASLRPAAGNKQPSGLDNCAFQRFQMISFAVAPLPASDVNRVGRRYPPHLRRNKDHAGATKAASCLAPPVKPQGSDMKCVLVDRSEVLESMSSFAVETARLLLPRSSAAKARLLANRRV